MSLLLSTEFTLHTFMTRHCLGLLVTDLKLFGNESMRIFHNLISLKTISVPLNNYILAYFLVVL